MSVSFEEFGRLQTQMLQLRQENYELKEHIKRLKLDATKKTTIDEKRGSVSMQNIFKTEKKKLEEKTAHEQEIEYLKECLRKSEEMSEERNTQVSAMKENLQALNSDNVKLRKELDHISKASVHTTRVDVFSDSNLLKEITELRAKVAELESQVKHGSLIGDSHVIPNPAAGEFPRAEILRRAAIYSTKLPTANMPLANIKASNPSDDLLDLFGSAPISQPSQSTETPTTQEASLLDLNDPPATQISLSQDALLHAIQDLWIQHSPGSQEGIHAKLIDDNSTEMMMYQLHVDELQTKVKDLTSKNSLLDIEIQQLKKQNSEQMRNVQSQLNFGKDRLRLLESEKSKLEDERDSALLKLSDSMKKLVQAQEELSIIQPKMQELKSQLSVMKELSDTEARELKERIKKVEADLIAEQKKSKQSVESDLESMRQKHRAEADAIKQAFEDRLSKEVENYMLLQNKLQAIMIEKEEKELNNRSLANRLEELEIKLNQKIDTVNQGELMQSALQKSLEQLQNVNAEQSGNIDTLTARIQDLMKVVDLLKEENDRVGSFLCRKDEKIAALIRAIQLAMRYVTELKTQYLDHRTSITKEIDALAKAYTTEYEKTIYHFEEVNKAIEHKNKEVNEKEAESQRLKGLLEDEYKVKAELEKDLHNQLTNLKEIEFKLAAAEHGKEKELTDLEDQISAMKIKEKQLQQLAKDLKAQLQAEKTIRDRLEGSDKDLTGRNSPAPFTETIKPAGMIKVASQENFTPDDAATLALKIGELKAENFALEDKANSLELRVSRLIAEVNQREKTIQTLKKEKERTTGAGPSSSVESSPNKLIGVVNTLLRKPLMGEASARSAASSETERANQAEAQVKLLRAEIDRLRIQVAASKFS